MPDNLASMDFHMKPDLLIVGAGTMAQEYVRVLRHLQSTVTVVGRGAENARRLRLEFPEIKVHDGGLTRFLSNGHAVPRLAIVAASIDETVSIARELLDAGVREILLEKPGSTSSSALRSLDEVSNAYKAKVVVGYNRRFYGSVLELERCVVADGGITSAACEFTEWIHRIDTTAYSSTTLARWVRKAVM